MFTNPIIGKGADPWVIRNNGFYYYSYSIMKVLIIGGTGLPGSEAAKELIKKGHSVTGMAFGSEGCEYSVTNGIYIERLHVAEHRRYVGYLQNYRGF